jgi:NADH:ubiquinone oxidoreductase subunit 3 (subunit A)
MNKPSKKNPTFGVAIFIVVVLLLVIATLFYNAITGKREYERANGELATPASAAASAVGAAPASQ